MPVQKIFSWSEKMKWAIKKFEMAAKKPAVLAHEWSMVNGES